METFQVVDEYLNKVREGIEQDAQSKNQKIPVSSFRVEVGMDQGALYAADYMKYLIYGRPPGKQPPPEAIQGWVAANPEVLSHFKGIFANITENGLAYIIGRKIGREGSAIYRGEKPGIDLLGVMENALPDFLKQLEQNQALEIATSLRQTIAR